MKIWTIGAAFVVLASIPSTVGAATLTNGTGDGKVTVGVSGAGAFGSAAGADTSNAFFDPVGPTAQGATTYESYVYFGFGGVRSNLSTVASTITAQTATSLTSNFTSSGLSFVLLQNLADTLTNGVQTGSLLTQAYSITNTTGASLTFDLVRYLDGDLGFNGTSNNDGGGRLISNGTEILFETDTAIGSSESDTFVGISNEGGTSTGFDIQFYSSLRGDIFSGLSLTNTIDGDGPDADQFVDAGQGYDLALALGRSFTLGAGESATFTTRTIFGTGAPRDVVLPPPPGVPEPATWGMMLAGFGLVGAGMRSRRRRTEIAFA